jgi:hypothetical protein
LGSPELDLLAGPGVLPDHDLRLALGLEKNPSGDAALDRSGTWRTVLSRRSDDQ